MQFNCKMGYSGNEQDYQLIKTSIGKLKLQKDLLRYLTNVLPNPTDIVTLDNAQDTVKSVKAQLANKNLIPYPYTNTTKTENGITFTVNSDGSITVNGTATANTVFDLETNDTMFTLPAGNYFLSGCPSGGDLTSYFMATTNAYDKFQRDFGSGIYVPSKGEKWKISIRIMSGYTADNLVFKPQIELGTTATAYTPYISDFSTVKVTGCGKNLLSNDTVISESTTAVNKKIWSGNLPAPCVFSQDASQFTTTHPSAAIFMFKLADGTEKYLAASGNRILFSGSTLKEIYFINWAAGTGTVKCQLEIGSLETD